MFITDCFIMYLILWQPMRHAAYAKLKAEKFAMVDEWKKAGYPFIGDKVIYE